MGYLIKEVLPEFYHDIERYFSRYAPEYLTQLSQLKIASVCDCGSSGCVQFFCNTPKSTPPLYYEMEDMPIYIFYGISNNILTGFDIITDYKNHYIKKSLKKLNINQNIETI